MATLPSAPTVEPDSLTAGDSLYFQKDLPNYPATAGWTLTYYLARQETAEQINFTATASGTGFLVNVAPTVTITWTPGIYEVQAQVSDGTNTFTVWMGVMSILANVTLAADTRSHARRVLDMLEAVFEGRASDDILNSKIEGTEIYRLPIDQLLMLKDRYQAKWEKELADDRLANGRGTKRNIYARITPVLGAGPGTFPFNIK